MDGSPSSSNGADINQLSQEDRIQLALQAAARDFNVSKTTLTARFHGRKVRREAHEEEQKLSAVQEEVLVTWMKVMGRRGMAFSPEILRQYATQLSGDPVGESWVKRFLSRHPDLKVRWTTTLEACRARSLNRVIVREYFDLICDLIMKYNVPPENIYNMDEKGIMLGVGKRSRAFVDRDQKTLYAVQDGNRELVTVIECISADGTALRPSVIYQGKRRDLEWGRHNPCNASISHSPNGWTDQELGAEWLEKDFEPQTAARNQMHAYRLLILDGHNSHCTLRFCKFAEEHRIIVICLPSHTTHVLQPCDVGVFGPLEKCWSAEVTKAGRHLTPITKYNLLVYYSTARDRAFKEATIKAAFERTGIWPLNPDVIDETAYEPALNTTTSSAQPIPATLPNILTAIPEATRSRYGATLPTISEECFSDVINPATRTSTSNSPIIAPANQSNFQYHIAVPPTPPHFASRQTLKMQNRELRTLVKAAGIQLEKDYVQMKLMDLENGRLRQRAFGQEKRKPKKTSTHARHMTGEDNMLLLARADWEDNMELLFKEAKDLFKVRREAIDKYYRDLAEKEKVEAKERREHERAERKALIEAQRVQKAAERKAVREAAIERKQVEDERKAEKRAEKRADAIAKKSGKASRAKKAEEVLPSVTIEAFSAVEQEMDRSTSETVEQRYPRRSTRKTKK